MNGFTLATGYYHRANLCKCGHALAVHLITLPLLTNPTLNSCSLCVRQGGNNQRHFFAARMETLPATSFDNCGQYGYYDAGGFGFQFTATATNVGTLNVGQTTIPFSVADIRRILPGMSWVPIPNNFANQVSYRIIGVTPGANTVTISPALLFNIGANQVGLFYGAFGSTMGPGCAANNQRGG